MSAASDLVDRIKAALPGSVTANLTVTSATWDLYEAYIFSCVLRAAAADGYVVKLLHGSGVALPQSGNKRRFVFRRGPGVIYSTGFSYAEISHSPSTRLEVHLGVRVDGQSGVAHECDVSVIEADEADLARTRGFHPRARSVVFACECKYYTVELPLGLLREFLGLTTDLRSQAMKSRLASNVSHSAMPALMKHHHREWTDELTPKSRAEQRFEGVVEEQLHRHRR